MYELQTGKNKSIYILMLIIVLVAFFTILAYTLFIDSHEYKYSQNIVATQIKHEEESTELETILENTTESIVGISKIIHVAEPTNALFLIYIFLMIVIIFYISLAFSKLFEKIAHM